ncbi:hypothetical protein M2132_001143 [Dysgonomonas sp. PH5-45]|uniref:glycosyltransferase family 1 protein n=1 Tax=unclassified Dysgonomonas TaxID=2630389 RepID=UPI002472F1EA|nr:MULTISPECIES: glycosyltransferase family 1 protein [unclassified Dysgonomonas]MDH6354812.1 hypothetical protein [Dysgonomonas sp. PH5-45]MDH6387711.1 hypothetical protein [Dysgonomonas sp. PH5-37]
MKNTYEYKGILTQREVESWQSWQVIFEWEDVLSENMNIPIMSVKRKWYQRKLFGYPTLCKIFNSLRLEKIYNPKKLYIYHQIVIQSEIDFPPWLRKKIIPWIVDGFMDESELPCIYKRYGSCPFLLISSIESYNYLKSKNCPLHIYYAPLSLSDKYTIDTEIKYTKKYDLISAGRINPVLEEYVKRYSDENDINFVYSKLENGNFYYFSTKTGRIGTFNTREEYLALLKQCKVALYSTPGIDGDGRSKGMNPVTPRIFELIASQCHIIARYPDTDETRFFELASIASHTDSYERFVELMDKYMNTDVDLIKYDNYLKKHYTSTRIKYLREAIDEYNLNVK